MHRLVEDIFNTRGDEIQCEEAQILIARCTQMLLATDESRCQYPALWHHFCFCSDCAEEYGLAMELARQEEEEEDDAQLQRLARIPSAPDRDRSAIFGWAVNAAVTAFPGFPPLLTDAGAPVRGEASIAEPVDIILSESALHVTFDVVINEQDDGLRDLFCTISPTGQSPYAAMEGVPVWLLLGDEGPPVSEQALDELGDVVFSRLKPGLYALRLDLEGQAHIVTDIVLP